MIQSQENCLFDVAVRPTSDGEEINTVLRSCRLRQPVYSCVYEPSLIRQRGLLFVGSFR